MKLSLAKIIIPALSLSLAGCSDDAYEGLSTSANTTIEAEIEQQPESRTAIDQSVYAAGEVGLLWTPSDSVGVFGNGASKNVAFVNDEKNVNLGNSTFSGNLGSSESPRYAYFPYSKTAGSDPSALKGTLSGEQSYSTVTGEIKGDYKYGTLRSGNTSNVKFTFRHLFALLRINIDASETAIVGERLEKIIFTVPGRQLYGDFTFSAIDGTYKFDSENTSLNSLTMNWTNTPQLTAGTTYSGFITCAPTIKNGDKINISVVTDNYQADFQVDVITDLNANGVYTIPLRLSQKAQTWKLKARPAITSLQLTAAANPGKILNHEVVNTEGKPGFTTVRPTQGVVNLEKQADNTFYAYIPYLNDRKLKPTFTVPSGAKVYNGETEVVSGVTEVDFAANPTLRVVVDGADRTYNVKLENTGLPVVVIEQGNSGQTESFLDIKVTAKSAEWPTTDAVTIYNADGSINVDHAVSGVRLRGNTTQGWDKKPFAIKFDKKQAVLGMPGHKRWVLLASRIDRSLLRNNVTFHMARTTQNLNGGDGMLWNPDGVNVELVIDGRHVGNYYLCEQIKIGSNRLKINDNYEDRNKDGKTTGVEDCGYLLEIDYHFDEKYKFNSSRRGLPVMFKDDVLGSDNETYIKNKFNQVEDYLARGNYTEAYKLIDVNSIIDHWLIYEITMNNEYGNPGSVYYYYNGTGGDVPGDGKFHAGPVWDFDWATYHNPTNRIAYGDYYAKIEQPDYSHFLYEAYNQTPNSSNGKKMYIWIPVLMKDASFRTLVQQRWKAIYATLSTEMPAYIRQQGALNSRSFAINDAMWPAPYTEAVHSGNDKVYNGDEKISGYDAVVENLVNCFLNRLNWLNAAITSGNFYTNGK